MALYVVTGGAGFIGSHLSEELLRRGHRVRVVDNLSTGKRSNIADHAAVEFLEADLADSQAAVEALRGADYVLHQAAVPSVPQSISDPLSTHHANITASVNVLIAARNAGVKRLVYAGSSAAYGNSRSLPVSEDAMPQPLSPYALQKLAAEQYCQLFTALYGFETVVVRYFNVFGPRQDPASPYSGVVSLFAKALLEGRSPTIFGDGCQTRDFTYVTNVVDGVLRACEAPGIAGQVFNVATGRAVSLNELAETMRSIVGASVVPIHEPPRRGEVEHSQADISKARALLGYVPSISLKAGLTRTITWCRSTRPVEVVDAA